MVALDIHHHPVVEKIFDGYKKEARRSKRLSPSKLESDCLLKTWYDFRWITAAQVIDGQKQRLFDAGNREEARFVADLESVGCVVTNQQEGFSFADGHGYCFTDGEITNVPGAEKTNYVLELKTASQSNFNAVKKHGVHKAQPGHVTQMQFYMHLKGLDRALYLVVCKNTDDLYAEVVYYDPEKAHDLVLSAEKVRDAPDGLPKKEGRHCSWCDHKLVCQNKAFPERNCRTCLHSTPIADGAWQCEFHKVKVDFKEQEAGCSNHRYIPSTVPGEQTDMIDDKIIYQINGREWTDE